MNEIPREDAADLTLDLLGPGGRGIVTRLEGEPAVARRIMELGLVPGTAVQLVRAAPLGDPLAFTVRGVQLSLRRSEARLVHVAPR